MLSLQPSLSKNIEELSVLHLCTVLVYSRQKFSIRLAKSIRPEVAKLLITSEAKDCIDTIRKQNKHADVHGIDMVIMDSDPSSVKILEYIHNRSRSSKFASHPIISTIVLCHGEDSDFSKNTEFIGGYDTKYITLPRSAKDIFSCMCSMMFRRHMIDKAYREIQQTQHSTAYPYLPIFEASRENKEDEEDEEEDADLNDINTQTQSNLGMAGAELDECTEILPILPTNVVNARAAHPVPDIDALINGKNRDETLSKEILERTTQDYMLLRELTEGRETDLIASELESNISKYKSQIIANNDTQATGQSKTQLTHPVANGVSLKKNISAGELGFVPRRVNLLDPRRRPKWEAKRGRNKTLETSGLNDAEVTLYFDRQPPDLSLSRTVGGLNKRKAQHCWNVFAAYGHISKGTLSSISSINEAMSPHEGSETHAIHDITPKNDNILSMQAVASPMQHLRLMEPARRSSGAQSSITNDQKFFERPSLSSDRSQESVSQERDVADKVDMRVASPATAKRNSLGIISPIDRDSINNDEPTSPNTHIEDYKHQLQKAERTLRKLLKETPPDVQIHKVIDVDLSNRNINKWEKGLIEEGKQAEKDGLLDHALSSITRAGINSKEPHLSKLFLASFYFRTGKYLSAIDNCTEALRMIAALKTSSMYNREDEFVGKYNRAIAYFRTGNDVEGIRDLEDALKIDPRNVTGLEVYAIVLRRLGRYDEAIKVKAEFIASMNSHPHKRPYTMIGTGYPLKHLAMLPHESHLDNRRRSNSRDSENDDSSLPGATPDKRLHTSEKPGLRKLHISLRSIGNTHTNGEGPRSNRSNRSLSSPMSTRDGAESERSHRHETAIYIHVPEQKCGLSLRDRKKIARMTEAQENNENEDYVESLTAFKMMNGFKTSLFETLFVKPDVLQAALLVHPHRRSPACIEVIGTNLRLIPLFRDLNANIIKEIAARIEYRTILPKVEIFQQNVPCDAICIVLKGSVQMRMDGLSRGTQNVIIGPDIMPGDVFGHTDLVFQQQESAFIIDLRKKIKENDTDMHGQKTNSGSHETNAFRGGLSRSMDSKSSIFKSLDSTKLKHSRPNTGNNVSSSDRKGTHSLNTTGSSQHPSDQTNKGNTSPNKRELQEMHRDHSKHLLEHDINPQVTPLPRPRSRQNKLPVDLKNIRSLSKTWTDLAATMNQPQNTSLRHIRSGHLTALPSQNLSHSSFGGHTSNDGDNHATVQSNALRHHRALAPGLFATYTTHSYCEVLMLNDKDFQRYLFNLAVNDFNKRFDVLKASGIFHTWSDLDVVRLARMGRIKSYKQGDIILAQKERPYHVYFVLSGLCKAYKTPNRIEVLERKLIEAKTKAEAYDLKYSYHHKLRNVIPHVEVAQVLSNAQGQLKDIAQHLNGQQSVASSPKKPIIAHKASKSHNSSLQSPTDIITADITSKITQSEAERFKLQLDIQQLEYLLHKAISAANGSRGSNIGGYTPGQLGKTTPNETSSSDMNDNKNEGGDNQPRTMDIDDESNCELATLKWPMAFGEACILEPDIGFSRGSIVATTSCEIFMIHKTQMQTFHIQEGFLARLHERSIVFPDDDMLVDIMIKKRSWKAYRESIIEEIPKSRWPKEKNLSDPFI